MRESERAISRELDAFKTLARLRLRTTNSREQRCSRRYLRKFLPVYHPVTAQLLWSQGQTIDLVGVDLRTDCFTHGQLYVLLSRFRRLEDIVVLVRPDRLSDEVAYAKNIVYSELLQ
ncbi:hypothetical protein J6590_066660 [Homalodisca vitripennis]|nr:hypothetical protein J6590_066660 [Homalodisca vitripennis]